MSIENISPLSNSVIRRIPDFYHWRRQILFIFNESDVLVIGNGWKMIAAYRYLYTKKEKVDTTNQSNTTSMTRAEVQKMIDESIAKNNEVNNAILLRAVRNIIAEEVRAIVKEEIKAIVKEEVRAVVKEEIKAIVKEEIRAIVKEEVRAVVKEEVRAIVKEEIRLAVDPINKRLDNLVKKNNLKE